MVIRAEEASIAYQSEMMKAIPWLLPYEWISERELVYQRGEGKKVTVWLQGEKKEEEILAVLEAFLQIQKEMESYLIDEEKLVLDPEWMYWDETEKQLRFAYVPWDTSSGNRSSFIKRFAQLLWNAGIHQKWQSERLILMLYRMQIAIKHQNQPQQWCQWMEREKRKIKERDLVKEQALDILTEEEPKEGKIGWLRRLKEKFPIAVR